MITIEKFIHLAVKIENRKEKADILKICKNIDCGYTLETPRRSIYVLDKKNTNKNPIYPVLLQVCI